MRFFAVVRDKHRIAQLVQEHNKKSPTYRYHPNQLYDRCVSRLFKERLHKGRWLHDLLFQSRLQDRTAALKAALETARINFRRTWGIQGSGPIDVFPMTVPAIRRTAGGRLLSLGVATALRTGERGPLLGYVWPSVKLVHDVDDLSQNGYGEYYTQKSPLTAAIRQRKKPGI